MAVLGLFFGLMYVVALWCAVAGVAPALVLIMAIIGTVWAFATIAAAILTLAAKR